LPQAYLHFRIASLFLGNAARFLAKISYAIIRLAIAVVFAVYPTDFCRLLA
jgi:hypothetical protein